MTLNHRLKYQWMLMLTAVCVGLLSLPTQTLARKRAIFQHKVPASATAGKSLRIAGKILYMDDLDYAELRIRVTGSKGDFAAIKMKQSGNKFYALVPKKMIKGTGMEYYVVGIDFNGKPRLLSGSPALPKQFVVVGGDTEAQTTIKQQQGDGDPGVRGA